MTIIETQHVGRFSKPSLFRNRLATPSRITDGLEIRPTGGFTLLEVTVVLAILSVFAAMSWPLLRPQFQASRLQGAAKEIRTELAKTRHRAMETGVAQHFLYQPGEGRFEVIANGDQQQNPFETVDVLATEHDGHSREESLDQQGKVQHAEVQHLPEGIRFAGPEFDLHSEVEAVHWPVDNGQSNAYDTMGGGGRSATEPHSMTRIDWAAPIVFYPDGRTSNASIRLESEAGASVDVTLRGLTGVATVGPLHRANDSLEPHLRNDRPTTATPRWHNAL